MSIYNAQGEIIPTGDADVLEEVAIGNNKVKPDWIKSSTYYLSFSDGTTHVQANCYLLEQKILIEDSTKLFIRLSKVGDSAIPICVYCYDVNKAYLGYKGFNSSTSTEHTIDLIDGTKYFAMYVSSAIHLVGADFCISEIQLSSFEQFVGADKLKREYVPEIPNEALKYNNLYGKKILLFGDSIPATGSKPNDTATLIGNITGADVYSCAVGGCSMGDRSNAPGFNPWSMHALAYAIANNDYTVPESSSPWGYCADILAHLKSTDFTEIDTALIMYGYNDGNTLDNDENPLDINTMGGALRYSIETLLSAYPNIKIVPCSLTYNTNVPNSNLYALKNAKIKEICDEYNLKFIDNFNIGIDDKSKDHYFSPTDGVHINLDGRKLVARNVAKNLI